MQNLSRKSSNDSIGDKDDYKICFSISILIPVAGLKSINETIESFIRQECSEWEILILRNGIQDLPRGTDVAEKDAFYQDYLLREIFIREKGKGNALNEGICRAKNNLICVLDADCILKDNALSQAVRHFDNDEVVAVGGRLLVAKEDASLLEIAQCCEYMITFQIVRRILDKLNAQCLISGAFGVFRKSVLLQMNGYDTDTVGEDMELVLRLLDGGYQKTGNQIVYDPTAVCYTIVPHSLKRLLHQRDRWQRGLMDCLIKHRNMIANPLYGMLGLATMSYQFVFELLGPICSILYMLWPWFRNMFPKSWLLCAGYAGLKLGCVIVAYYLEVDKDVSLLLKQIPKLVWETIVEICLHVLITGARLYGMVTFLKRRPVW